MESESFERGRVRWLVLIILFAAGCLYRMPGFFLLASLILLASRIGLTIVNRHPFAGRWLNAPVAEVDKSTLGKLLASRMTREPGLHVVTRSQTTSPDPATLDALYDPELDGYRSISDP